MRKNEICRNIAEDYVEEEIFSETDLDYFPAKSQIVIRKKEKIS